MASTPGWSRFRRASVAALLLLATACGGRYAELIGKGDKLADAGMWDDAAAAYKAAVKLEPENPEALIKLKQVKKRQSEERLTRARALERRGDLPAALELVQEAVELDPANAKAQEHLDRLSDKALDKAKAHMKAGRLERAYELTRRVVAASPDHPRAKKLDKKVRGKLAQRSYDRAEKFLKKDQRGNALVELAACLTYRPDYPDAKIIFGKVKLELEQKLRYVVVVNAFKGKGKGGQLASSINAKVLKQSLDEKLLVDVTTKAPRKKDDRAGVSLRGDLSEYRYAASKRNGSRSCDYVCGTTSKPNPDRPRIEQEVARHEKTLAGIDDDISRAQQDVDRYQQEVDRIQKSVDRKQEDADKARAEYEKCTANLKPTDSSSKCSSKKSNYESKQRYLEQERRRLESPRRNMTSAREKVTRHRKTRDDARRGKERATEKLRNTPVMITVDKYCPFNYTVRTHTTEAAVVLALSMDKLRGGSILSGERFPYKTKDTDSTFDAHPGRCKEVRSGDPLTVRREPELRKRLTKKMLADVRGKVVSSYDAYRQHFLSSARRHEAAGETEEAVEAYVRYVLTGPHKLKEKPQIAKFFKKTKGFGKLDALWTL